MNWGIWRPLGVIGPIWDHLGGNLGPFGGHLEEIWTHLGVTWAIWEVIRRI